MAVKTSYVAIACVVVVLGAGAVFLVTRNHAPTSMPAPTAPQPLAVPAPTPPGAVAAAPADCMLPGPPPVAPSGYTATAADMKLGHDALQGFVEQLEAYQACRNNQADHAAPGVSAAQKELWIQQGNQAVDEANAIAASFADQLKIFKAQPAAKK